MTTTIHYEPKRDLDNIISGSKRERDASLDFLLEPLRALCEEHTADLHESAELRITVEWHGVVALRVHALGVQGEIAPVYVCSLSRRSHGNYRNEGWRLYASASHFHSERPKYFAWPKEPVIEGKAREFLVERIGRAVETMNHRLKAAAATDEALAPFLAWRPTFGMRHPTSKIIECYEAVGRSEFPALGGPERHTAHRLNKLAVEHEDASFLYQTTGAWFFVALLEGAKIEVWPLERLPGPFFALKSVGRRANSYAILAKAGSLEHRLAQVEALGRLVHRRVQLAEQTKKVDDYIQRTCAGETVEPGEVF